MEILKSFLITPSSESKQLSREVIATQPTAPLRRKRQQEYMDQLYSQGSVTEHFEAEKKYGTDILGALVFLSRVAGEVPPRKKVMRIHRPEKAIYNPFPRKKDILVNPVIKK